MKKNILLILKIFVSGVLLIYLFTIIPFPEILISLGSAKVLYVLTGLILSAAVVFLSAAETQYLTNIQGLKLSIFAIIKIHLAVSFYSLFLPGMISGGVIKWFKFSRNGSKFSAASVVVFNRFLEIFFTVFIGLLFMSAAPSTAYEHRFATGWLLVFLCLAFVYWVLFSKKLSDLFAKVILKVLWPQFIIARAEKFMAAIKQFQNLQLKHHLQILGLLFLYHFIGIIVFFCFMKSLNIDVSFWAIGWIRSVVIISVMIPLSFSGLGIREGLLVFLLSQYGTSPIDSMALSFLLFSCSLLFSLIGGVFEFSDFISSKKLRHSMS